jgi:hypothetical protein
MEHQNLEQVANDALMVDREIHFKGIHFCSLGDEEGQNLFLPNGGHDEVVDEYFELVLSDALFQNILIVLHESIDVELHVEFLQILVLLEPQTTPVVFNVYLRYLFYYVSDLFLVQDVPYSVHRKF